MKKVLLSTLTRFKIRSLTNKPSYSWSWKAKTKFWKRFFSKSKKVKKFMMKIKDLKMNIRFKQKA